MATAALRFSSGWNRSSQRTADGLSELRGRELLSDRTAFFSGHKCDGF